MNVGIVGCGRVSSLRHLPALARIEGARVVALSDLDERRLEETARRFAVDRRYLSVADLLDDPAVDTVAVCVPTSGHADVAVAALEAGKHVLIEKPLALRLEDARRIAAAADRSPGVAAVGFNLRHHRLVRAARALVRTGVLGELQALVTTFTSSFDYRATAGAWRFERDLGGGALIEMAPHHLDLWRCVLDREVVEVAATARSGRDADESVLVTGVLDGDVLASSLVSQYSTNANGFDVYGSKGVLHVDCYRYDSLGLRLGRGFGTDAKARLAATARTVAQLPRMLARGREGGDYVISYRDQWRSFLSSVESGRPAEATVEDGVRGVEILAAALDSLADGTRVAVANAAAPVGSRAAVAS